MFDFELRKRLFSKERKEKAAKLNRHISAYFEELKQAGLEKRRNLKVNLAKRVAAIRKELPSLQQALNKLQTELNEATTNLNQIPAEAEPSEYVRWSTIAEHWPRRIEKLKGEIAQIESEARTEEQRFNYQMREIQAEIDLAVQETIKLMNELIPSVYEEGD